MIKEYVWTVGISQTIKVGRIHCCTKAALRYNSASLQWRLTLLACY